MTNTSLFSEFESVNSKAYKQKIQVDLKGASYNDTLLWRTDEGIDVKPFYHRDGQSEVKPIPGMPTQWNIGESIFIDDIKIAAKLANNAAIQGAEQLFFTANKPFDFKGLFEVIDNKEVPCHFSFNFLDSKFYKDFLAFAKAYSAPIKNTTDHQETSNRIELRLDIIHNLVTDGNWFHNMSEDHSILEDLISTTDIGLTIDTRIYHLPKCWCNHDSATGIWSGTSQ